VQQVIFYDNIAILLIKNKNIMKKVTIYSTPTCHFCHAAKDFFNENNVEFTDYNVALDQEKRKEMMEKTGQLGVPVIMIGNQIVIGFDKSKLKELLGL
jgi:glutaredoxin-like YruB-family protein